MAEADDGQPKRCVCGFWGSPNTMNMCSKCYKEYLENPPTTSTNANTTNKGAPNKSTTAMLSDLLAGFPPTTSANRNQPTTQQQEQENVNNSSKMAKIEVESVEETDSFLSADAPIQKNKRRCFTCRQKLELAQRELGQCKCGYVFCLLHRLPEQHNCAFDHKVSGRQEAMKNMVDTGRKRIGRSFHRMDSKPEY